MRNYSEILITTVLVGLLSSWAVQTLPSMTQKAQTAKTKLDLRQITSACQLYYLDHGSFPKNINTLVKDYLQAIPPSGIEGYQYVVDEIGNACLLKDRNNNGRRDPDESDILN